MSYSSDEPFKDREHISWEIGYCGKASNYITYLSLAFIARALAGHLVCASSTVSRIRKLGLL